MPHWQVMSINNERVPENSILISSEPMFNLSQGLINDTDQRFFFDATALDDPMESVKWKEELEKIKPNPNTVKPNYSIQGFCNALYEIANYCLHEIVFQFRFKTIGAARAFTAKHTEQMLTGCTEINAKKQRLAEDDRFEETMKQVTENLKLMEKSEGILEMERLALEDFHANKLKGDTCIEQLSEGSEERITAESLVVNHDYLSNRRAGKNQEADQEEARIRKLPCGNDIMNTKNKHLTYLYSRHQANTRIGAQFKAACDKWVQPQFDGTIEMPSRKRRNRHAGKKK